MSNQPSNKLKVACLQLNAQDDIQANIETLLQQVEAAAKAGAQLIVSPENAVMMTFGRQNILSKAFYEAKHPALPALQAQCKQLGVYHLVGSLTIKLSDDYVANRSYLISPDGIILQSYDKLHMFDVDLGNGESYQESATFRAGEESCLIKTNIATIGQTICYDLRFPQLFSTLATNGAQIICVPAAFTVPTGKAHWEVLLRARAIETGSFILAAGQTGTHPGNRQTYGHSMIISPWGDVLAGLDDAPDILVYEIDLAEVTECRRKVPNLKHQRSFAPPYLVKEDRS